MARLKIATSSGGVFIHANKKCPMDQPPGISFNDLAD
jgi:hypothetical protein